MSLQNRTQAATTIAKHVLLNEAKDKNLVFSPVAIHLVLTMIAAGSKGRTLEQMRAFMNSDATTQEQISMYARLLPVLFSDGKDALGGPKLSFVNGVWIDDKSLLFTPGFTRVLDTVGTAAPNQSVFHNKASEAANEVNLWAEEKSGGLIKEFLPSGSVNGSTRLMFANAIFYKGDWAYHMFNRSETKDGEFHLLNGSSVQVPFMTCGNSQLIRVCDGFKVLGLRYRKDQDNRGFYMYIFLPDANDGLPSLVEKLSADSEFLDNYRPFRRELVRDFKIPRFKISFGFEASKVLKDLGLVLPFSGEVDGLSELVHCAEGTTMFEITEIPCVSSIFHKSILEVDDEESKEAAFYSVGTSSLEADNLFARIDFVADHPFMFMIREEDVTSVPLLVGHVLNPLDG